MTRPVLALGTLACAALLASCGGGAASVMPTALNASPTPAGKHVTPATDPPTEEPTAAPRPTDRPTATPRPTTRPSATSRPTATPRPTIRPSATPRPTTRPTATPTPTPSGSSAGSYADHITVVIMENYGYSQIVGNGSAPYINHTLIPAGALFTSSYGVSHPSEPNYLALFSGSTQGLTSDACPVTYGGNTLATELRAHAKTFVLYAESMPSANYLGCNYGGTLGYWRKHNPAADFAEYAGETQPYTASSALSSNVTFIVPNQSGDMHSSSIATGDAWLKAHIPAIEAYNATHNGLLIVTFDEGDAQPDNHIFTVMVGPMVQPGTYSQRINHYNVLRLIESNFALPLLGSAAGASSITGALH